MKRLFFTLAGIIIAATMMAQAPNAIKYQAVARDASGDVIANQSVSLTISILQDSVTGTEVFTETHDSTTNAYGLVNLNIGAGNPTDFANIDWANGPYFVKVVKDGNVMGTSQLLSVPYAKYADNAGNVLALDNTTAFTPDADYEPATKKYVDDNVGGGDFYLGQDTLGGIVYYIYTGSDGQQHGLIVSKTESTGTWSGSTLVGADRTEDGAYNTNLMPSGSGTVKQWVIDNFDETVWYVPSIDELSLLWHNRFHVNKALRSGGSTLLSYNATLWSSTEYDASYAFTFLFFYGYTYYYNKASTYSVRAVRAF